MAAFTLNPSGQNRATDEPNPQYLSPVHLLAGGADLSSLVAQIKPAGHCFKSADVIPQVSQ